jgi:hypothetical protein
MYHPLIVNNLRRHADQMFTVHDRCVDAAAETDDPLLRSVYLQLAQGCKEVAEGYKKLHRHAQAVNGEEPPGALAVVPPAPTAPAAPASAELAGANS